MTQKKRPTARRPRRASTTDVLGPHPPRRRIPSRFRPHYDRLVQLREEILREQAGLAKEALEQRPRFSQHMADAGTDTYHRDLAFSMLSSEQDALYQIDQAIDRIRNGTYGICELTGKPIERRRLEAIPWTRFSAAAERKLERDGARRRPGLGPREAILSGEPAEAPEPAEEPE